MAKKIDLLIIDPQIDFCDPNGSLFVNGADGDMKRLAAMVKRIGSKLNDIHVTLDSHHCFDIAHPIFWKDAGGKNPDPFTMISVADVESRKWITSIPSLMDKGLNYVKQLESNGRYPLVVWPYHCIIGSKGHGVYPDLFDVLFEWEKNEIAQINYVTKGSNIYTEHYSAIQADVPDPADPSTQINTGLIKTLEETDQILVAGEAGSHCLANTVRDIANNFSNQKYVEKIVLLEDATSPVGGFENLQEDFIKEMKAKGMKMSKTTDILI
jgi:nicotinamidase-related amidase